MFTFLSIANFLISNATAFDGQQVVGVLDKAKISCIEVIQTSIVLQYTSLDEMYKCEAQFEERLKEDVGGDFSWAPTLLQKAWDSFHHTVFDASVIYRKHPECFPRALREQLMYLIHHSIAIHKGAMRLMWWGAQHNRFHPIQDHPADMKRSDASYIGSMMKTMGMAREISLQEGIMVLEEVRKLISGPEGEAPLLRQVEQDNKMFTVDRLVVDGVQYGEDGGFDGFDILRRDLFDEWYIDYGVIGTFLRMVATRGTVGSSLLDVGAGGGHYAKLMNQTSLVTVDAVDAAGTPGLLEIITHGKVKFMDISEPVNPSQKTYDYVMCLEVAEHIQKEKTATFVNNFDRLARKGLLLSWSSPELCGLGWGHVNCRTAEEVISLIESSTPFRLDKGMTSKFRDKSEISWIKKTIMYFEKPTAGGPRGGVASGLSGLNNALSSIGHNNLDPEISATNALCQQEKKNMENEIKALKEEISLLGGKRDPSSSGPHILFSDTNVRGSSEMFPKEDPGYGVNMGNEGIFPNEYGDDEGEFDEHSQQGLIWVPQGMNMKVDLGFEKRENYFEDTDGADVNRDYGKPMSNEENYAAHIKEAKGLLEKVIYTMIIPEGLVDPFIK